MPGDALQGEFFVLCPSGLPTGIAQALHAGHDAHADTVLDADRDCPIGSECEHKGQGGDCTYPCRFHQDCPPGWACVNSHGGTCHALCASDRDCRIGLKCKKKDNEGTGGDSHVCEP